MPEFSYYLTAILLIGMIAAVEIGRRLGQGKTPDEVNGTGTLDSAVYALFGLLLAFIFSGATSRYDQRLDLITQEANAIGTAYLRIDLLPEASRQKLRPLYREYVNSRLETYRSLGDARRWATENQRDQTLQNQIWAISIDAARQTGSPAVLSLVTPALNEMIDISTTRMAAAEKHPPPIIYAMLIMLALAASLLSGIAMARNTKRPMAHILAFALSISATVYVILDIEYPRQGLVRIDAADKLLIELLKTMN